jgi:glycosyltransferase involved in cell wall biosynthesis
MRIAYFTDTFTPELNGVTNTLSKLQTYLERKDIRYAFFAPSYNRDIAPEKIFSGTKPPRGPEEGHKGLHRFKGLKTALSPESRLAFPPAREIFERCDAFKPDLVHVVTELGIGYKGMKYARSRGLPLVMSYHTDYCKYLRYFHLDFLKPLAESYLSWFYRFADKILAPSRHTLEQLFRKQYRNLGIWSRGVDSGAFNPRCRSEELRKKLGLKGKFAFLYVGRLSPEKGLDMLIHAAAEIEGRFPGETAFVFTGGGPWEDFIRQKNFPNVILTGFKTGRELSELYASCDCFAFPSGTETFGNAPLEAMASGLPVAGIAGGGVLEFLRHGKNALLCADGDRDAFTGYLIAIMGSKGLRRKLAENALKTAAARNWDFIFESLLGVYAGLVQNRGDTGTRYRDVS